MPYIIYAGTESLIKKINGCASNPENSLRVKIGELNPYRYSMSTIWEFDHIENIHTLYWGKDGKVVLILKNTCEKYK